MAQAFLCRPIPRLPTRRWRPGPAHTRDSQALVDKLRPEISLLENPPGMNMLRAFGHLMNQYAAAYHGYLWYVEGVCVCEGGGVGCQNFTCSSSINRPNDVSGCPAAPEGFCFTAFLALSLFSRFSSCVWGGGGAQGEWVGGREWEGGNGREGMGGREGGREWEGGSGREGVGAKHVGRCANRLRWDRLRGGDLDCAPDTRRGTHPSTRPPPPPPHRLLVPERCGVCVGARTAWEGAPRG